MSFDTRSFERIEYLQNKVNEIKKESEEDHEGKEIDLYNILLKIIKEFTVGIDIVEKYWRH